MKNFFEWLKDLIYDSVDYIIILGIVGFVVFIIGWRLDLLFAKDALDTPPNIDIVVEDNKEDDKAPSLDNNISDDKDNDEEIIEDLPTTDNETEPNTAPPSSGQTVKISIPEGSLPSKIGSILESSGLVSKNDFVEKAIELKLDTKLKSGEYEIQSGSSIEEIVKIIAKAK